MKRGFLNDRQKHDGFGPLRDPRSCRGSMLFSQQDRLGSSDPWHDKYGWGNSDKKTKGKPRFEDAENEEGPTNYVLKTKLPLPESDEPWIDVDSPSTLPQSRTTEPQDQHAGLSQDSIALSPQHIVTSYSGNEDSPNNANATNSSSNSTLQSSSAKQKKSMQISILQPPRRGGPTLLQSDYGKNVVGVETKSVITFGKSIEKNPVLSQKFQAQQEKSNSSPNFGVNPNKIEKVAPPRDNPSLSVSTFGSTILQPSEMKSNNLSLVAEGFGSEQKTLNLEGFGISPASFDSPSLRDNPFRAQPMLPNKTSGVPKAALLAWYSQKPRCVQITNECYVTWNNGGMPHELRFTSVFVCPLSGELFLSGRYGDPESYQIDPVTNIVWFKNKKAAEHGAASRAYDCQSYRQYFISPTATTHSVHLGSEKPYLEAKLAAKYDHISVPPPLPPLAPEIQEEILNVQKKFHDIQQVREWNQEAEKKEIKVSNSSKQQQAIVHQRYNDNYRRDRRGAC